MQACLLLPSASHPFHTPLTFNSELAGFQSSSRDWHWGKIGSVSSCCVSSQYWWFSSAISSQYQWMSCRASTTPCTLCITPRKLSLSLSCLLGHRLTGWYHRSDLAISVYSEVVSFRKSRDFLGLIWTTSTGRGLGWLHSLQFRETSLLVLCSNWQLASIWSITF